MLSKAEKEAVMAELTRLLEKHGSQAEVGRVLGESQQVMNKAFRDGQFGPVVAAAVARHVGLEDVGQLVRRHAGRAELAVAVEEADEYPERSRAKAAARLLGYDERDIAVADAVHGFKNSTTHPTERWWFAKIDRARADREADEAHGLVPGATTSARRSTARAENFAPMKPKKRPPP